MKWKTKAQPAAAEIKNLSETIHTDRVNSILLLQRGILDYNAAKDFFKPELALLHDPFLMRDSEKAVEIILNTIRDNHKILVYGDYDVDGTTSVALFYTYLKSIEANCGYYIPDREKEGYGISKNGIDYAKANDFKLIVCLDCGIKANEMISYAKSLDIGFIVCDHHLPGTELPPALAILDPKRNDCEYPYKELSGCGIGFKLISAIQAQLKKPFSELMEYLDLVAISIAADIVPITGENRVLCYHGLTVLNEFKRPAIKALFQNMKAGKKITVNELVFVVAPRINAAGRIDHALRAVELLLSKTDAEATVHAEKINQTNANRKEIDQEMTLEAKEMLTGIEERKSTVVFNPSWHKGVVGIVASRLMEKVYRPTIVLTKSGEMLTGSARSVKNFDIHHAIESCSHLLVQFGGHKHAAGLTLKPENLEAFTKLFEETVASTILPEMLEREIEVDVEIHFNEINKRFYDILKLMGPHGPGNMTPVFCTRNVIDTGWGKVVGTNHLKAEFYQIDNPTLKWHAIGFDKGDYVHLLQKKLPLEISYSVAENNYNNIPSLQLFLRDIKLG